MVMAPPLGWNRIAGRVRRLRGRALDRHACDSERYVEVAARGPRIGADFVRARHELGGLRAVDPGRIEVERDGKSEAALARRADADSRSHARAGEVERPPGREAQQARLEAGRIADGEELLRVRPGPARASHLGRDVEFDVKSTVRRPRMSFASALGARLGRVQDPLDHRSLLYA